MVMCCALLAHNAPYSLQSQCSINSFLIRDTPSIIVTLFPIKSNRGKIPNEEVIRRETKRDGKEGAFQKHLCVASHDSVV